MKKKRKYQTVQPKTPPEPEVVQLPPSGPVQIGDIVVRRPVTFSDNENKTAHVMRGRVVYVHPKGRFHVVEFGEGKRTVRESFAGVNKGVRDG